MKFKPRALFSEIVAGHSLVYWNNSPIYFKHFTNTDIGSFELIEEKIYEDAHNEGLPTEEEKLIQLKRDGIWTEQNELELRAEREFLEGQLQTKKNLLLDSQIKAVNKQIEESQIKIHKILSARANCIGYVVEVYVTRKMNEKNILNAAFQDAELKIPFFTLETFNDLEDSQLEELIILYNGRLNFISNNIKKLSISPFFQNLFHVSKEIGIYSFYGDPVIKLSLFKVDLWIYGNYFCNILSGDFKPTEEMLENPELIIENFTKNNNLKAALKDGAGDLQGGSVVGASIEEMKNAGISGKRVNFRKKLAENSNELNAIELARIFNS